MENPSSAPLQFIAMLFDATTLLLKLLPEISYHQSLCSPQLMRLSLFLRKQDALIRFPGPWNSFSQVWTLRRVVAAGLFPLLPLTHERKEEAIQKTEEMRYNREEERQLEPTEGRHVGMHT